MNPLKKAFSEPLNLIGLAVIAGASAALLTPLPAMFGVVAEAGYLLFVPGSAWYARRLAALNGGTPDLPTPPRDATQQREERARALPPDLYARYQRLQKIRSEIDQKVRAQVSFQPEILAKLDQLTDQFLSFAAGQVQFIAYLQSLLAQQGGAQSSMRQNIQAPYVSQQNSDHYPYQQPVPASPIDLNESARRAAAAENWAQWAVGRIQTYFNSELNRSDPSSETDPSVKELKQKRIDVLSKRSEYVGRIGKAVANISLQLQLIEDTFGLIDDEVSTQNPDQVLGEIDNLMSQTDALTKSLTEVSQMYQEQRIGAG